MMTSGMKRIKDCVSYETTKVCPGKYVKDGELYDGMYERGGRCMYGDDGHI